MFSVCREQTPKAPLLSGNTKSCPPGPPEPGAGAPPGGWSRWEEKGVGWRKPDPGPRGQGEWRKGGGGPAGWSCEARHQGSPHLPLGPFQTQQRMGWATSSLETWPRLEKGQGGPRGEKRGGWRRWPGQRGHTDHTPPPLPGPERCQYHLDLGAPCDEGPGGNEAGAEERAGASEPGRSRVSSEVCRGPAKRTAGAPAPERSLLGKSRCGVRPQAPSPVPPGSRVLTRAGCTCPRGPRRCASGGGAYSSHAPDTPNVQPCVGQSECTVNVHWSPTWRGTCLRERKPPRLTYKHPHLGPV